VYVITLTTKIKTEVFYPQLLNDTRIYIVSKMHDPALSPCEVALGGLLVTCLTLDARFAGSNPAEDDGF
jgi:hypothetical protein